MNISELKTVFGPDMKIDEPDISRMIADIINGTGVVGELYYGAKWHDAYNKRRLCNYLFETKMKKLRKIMNYVELVFPVDLISENGNKRVKRDKYNLGEFIIVRDICTHVEMGYIGIDVVYTVANEKIDNISKYLREVTGFYVTPNMRLSNDAKNMISMNFHMSKIHELMEKAQLHAQLVRGKSNFDEIFIPYKRYEIRQLIDKGMFNCDINELTLTKETIEHLRSEGINTVEECVQRWLSMDPIPNNVHTELMRYLPEKVFECLCNHIVNSYNDDITT